MTGRKARAEAKAARLAHARSQRQTVKRRYRALFGELSAAFFEVDPIGINFDDNTDEYDAEVGTVLPRLSTCRSADDVNRVLVEEFTLWFDDLTPFNRERLAELAERIWSIWTGSGARLTFGEAD